MILKRQQQQQEVGQCQVEQEDVDRCGVGFVPPVPRKAHGLGRLAGDQVSKIIM